MCIYARGIDVGRGASYFLLDFGIVPTVCYFLFIISSFELFICAL